MFHFAIASYLKLHKFKVSNEVQSNKVNRGASTAVSVSHIHFQMRFYSKNPFHSRKDGEKKKKLSEILRLKKLSLSSGAYLYENY